MRGFIAVLVIVAAIVLGVGFYRGWFTFTVDQEKIQKDEETAKDKVKKILPRTKDKTGTPTDGAKEDSSN